MDLYLSIVFMGLLGLLSSLACFSIFMIFFKTSRGTDTHRFYEELTALRVSLESDLALKRKEVEDDIQVLISESNKSLLENQAKADQLSIERLRTINEGLAQSLKQVQEEYSRVEAHFRSSMKEDVTLHVIACAYAVVANNHPPRDIKDEELVKAIFEHQKSGGDSVLVAPVKKITSSGGLN
jgi:hypothetical protein